MRLMRPILLLIMLEKKKLENNVGPRGHDDDSNMHCSTKTKHLLICYVI